MSKTKSYTNAPAHIAKGIDDSIPVEDFLPSPQEIVEMLSKEETVPVTMKLKKKTVERYKRFAQEKGVKYQTFVSSVLDSYAQRL
ncbi:MAG: CopG family transcriptional regulator [Dehalococcoidia bacterium]|nr:CopG family transcriptional regulator [Dehalococcoidia bacterium]